MNANVSSHRGHWPTVIAASVYLEASLLVWALMIALGGPASEAFGLSAVQTGVVVAAPIVVGLALRPIAGLLADRFSPRRVALAGLLATALPLVLGWLWVNSYPQLVFVSALLGLGGASFAVALPMAGQWYRRKNQGLVLGLVGAGNSGTAVAMLATPGLVATHGWHEVFGLALVPLGLAFAGVALLARDVPAAASPAPLRDSLRALRHSETGWYCTFYALTFGGFVGITGYLTMLFRLQYQVDPIHAAILAALCSLAGSLARPIGGLLADRYGGVNVLFLVYVGVGVVGLRMSYMPHLDVALISMMLMLAMMGIGNGAVFQMIAQRHSAHLGAVAGLVGAAGGLAGFLLPVLMGLSHDWLGRFGPALFVVGLGALLAAGMLLQAHRHWESAGVAPIASRDATRREVEVMSRS